MHEMYEMEIIEKSCVKSFQIIEQSQPTIG
jgi:hypothetical protein